MPNTVKEILTILKQLDKMSQVMGNQKSKCLKSQMVIPFKQYFKHIKEKDRKVDFK